jgi:chromosome segregation ATPase
MNKKKKQKIKKLKLPLKKMAKREKDYVAVLLEDMNSNMKAFWDGLEGVRVRGENTFKEVALIKEDIFDIKLEMGVIKSDIVEIKSDIVEMKSDIVEMKSDIVEIKSDIVSINGRLTNIEKEISSIKYEIGELRMILTQKADVEKLGSLEIRVRNIENHLKLSVVN